MRAFAIAKSVATGAILAAELGFLAYAVYQALNPDAPELDELYRRLRAELDARAQYRAAIRQVLRSIDSLPETEPEP